MDNKKCRTDLKVSCVVFAFQIWLADITRPAAGYKK